MVLKYDFNIGDVAPPDVVGYLDDVSIEDTPIIDAHSLTNYVDVRRGTDSSGDFSRGNNLPAVATPNGFNFYTPMTDVNTN
jgi:putative alpha-1,2-mannosidase